MTKRREAVLICGEARRTMAAIARELTAAGLPVLIREDAAEVRAAGRVSGVRKLVVDSTSSRLVAEAWTAAGGLAAVVLCPAAPAEPADPDLHDWQSGLDIALKVPFFMAKHAGLRLAGAGGGRLIVAIEEPGRGASPVACVAAEGMRCLADGLARALPHAVVVSTVAGAGGGASRDIARAVRWVLTDGPRATGAVLRLGAEGGQG